MTSVNGPKLVVIVPVGPGLQPAHVQDTIDSVLDMTVQSSSVLLVDDSSGTVPLSGLEGHRVDRIVCSGRSGVGGGLFLNVCRALEKADDMGADVVLRLDSDAVMTAPGSEIEAHAFFRAHPDVGALGSFRYDCNGETRDWNPVAQALALAARRRCRPRQSARAVRRLWARAAAHDYQPGEHALAAALYMSGTCIRDMRQAGLLGQVGLRRSPLGDDHLLGLCVRAAGYLTEDFAVDPLPLGVAWRGLPAGPDELLRRNKKIVHSVKNHPGWEETELRSFFARHRADSPYGLEGAR